MAHLDEMEERSMARAGPLSPIRVAGLFRPTSTLRWFYAAMTTDANTDVMTYLMTYVRRLGRGRRVVSG